MNSEQFYQAELMKYSFHGLRIPEYMWDGISKYLAKGIIPGDFLQGVITKNLEKIMNHADSDNVSRIHVYYNFFYNNAPSNSWGDMDKMLNWHMFHQEISK